MTEVKINTTPNFLRIIALVVFAIGWIVSLGFTLHAGHNNRSVFLVILFLGWVSSPFLGQLVAASLSRHRPVVTRKAFYILMILLSIGSVVGYSGVLSPAGMKPAFIFLVIPLISWVLIMIIITVTISRARKKKSLL
jgi:hypothetical protein